MGREVSGVDIRDGSIRLCFTFEGKRHRKTLMVNGKPLSPTKGNISFATKQVDTIKSKIRTGDFIMAEFFPEDGDVGSGLTVSSLLDSWLAGQRIEDSTKAGYVSAIKFWKGAPYSETKTTAMGDLPLRKLLPSQIRIAIASRPHLTGKTVNNYVSVLREALESAVTDKVLPSNPADAIKRAKHQRAAPDPFTAEERENIIAKMHERHPGQAANMTEFWFWTGLRTSELFGLSWPHVDFASGAVVVTEAVVRGTKKKKTKTNVERTVKLNSRALAVLKRQRQYTQMAADERVFHDPRTDAGWHEERAFRRSYWTPVLKALGIRYRRPYNCRHTYATALLMAGANHAWSAKQLGHSIEMFLKTYAKWIDGNQDAVEMARLESTIVPGVSPAAPAVPAST